MNAPTAGGGMPPAAAVRLIHQPRARMRARRVDRISHGALFIAAGVSLLLVGLVVTFLAVRAAPVVTNGDIGLRQFFTGFTWDPDSCTGFGGNCSFGALTPILGSVMAVGLGLLLAIPVAVCVAIVLAETDAVLGQRYLRPAIEVFVGIPSVVYGYLGLTILVPAMARFAPPGRNGSGLAAAAIVLAVMVVPTIATISTDALLSLSPSLKEASYALGATQWQTIRRVLLPAARGGIISGVVLGLARAMGEALAVALVIGGVNKLPQFGAFGIRGFVTPSLTMTTTITDGVQNLAINPEGTAARYMLALVLLLVSFLSIIVVRLVNRRGQVVV